MRLIRSEVEAVDLEPFRPFVADDGCFFLKSGKEHYKLLAHLSTRVTAGVIFDVGTSRGDSALALSHGGAAVETFDIADNVHGRPHPPNVHRHLIDLCTPDGREAWKSKLLESQLIFIDIDPHEGTREYELVRWLEANRYRGLIVLDDIWYFKPMRDNLWSRIEGRYKTDATTLGHWSGTGIVSFGGRVEIDGETDTSNWTLVTGYFDLTKKADASPELCTRPAGYFIDSHGAGTLGLDQNLVVYCEPALEEKIWSMRPQHLHAKTRVVVQEFEDFPLTRHQPRVVSNRGGPWCPTHQRSTASYYLFCMARYAMLKLTIADNPFHSTHFAWVNICIERMGFQNLIHLNEALGVQREKFSTCFIDYAPESLVRDLDAFFGGKACLGRCTMCSGFFTGNARYMKEVCDRLETEFLRCLEAGYGHSDEQLYPMVYFDRPDLFDWYPGDYTEMVTNYARVYERAEQPVVNLIRNSLAAGDHAVCARACKLLWQSYTAGTCSIAEPYLNEFLRARATVSDAIPRSTQAQDPERDLILGVPTFNRYDLLDRLIASAEAGTRKPSTYLVVDNGDRFWEQAPTMPGVTAALTRGAQIDVLASGRNLGVAASWNALLDRAGAVPIVISNDDVELGLDTFETLGRAIVNHDFVIADGGPHASGWCLFAQSARCTATVGSYDENFFPAYYEDSDYERRMLLAAIAAHREPVTIRHEGWATMKVDPGIADGQRRSAEYFRRKWGALPDEPKSLFSEPFGGSPEPPLRKIIPVERWWERYTESGSRARKNSTIRLHTKSRVMVPEKLAIVTVVHFDTADPNARRVGIMQNRIDRLQYFQTTVDHFTQLANEVSVTVITNTANPDQLAVLSESMQCRGFSFEILSVTGLADPWSLPQSSGPILRKLAEDQSISHFMHFEYDTLLTRENVLYWVEARELLRSRGLIPSFLRVERRHTDARWYVTDTKQPLQLSTMPRVEASESLHFVSLPTPYQGMYLLDRELVNEYLSEPPPAHGLGRHWGGIEGTLEGLTFVNVPTGFHARNVVPYVPVERRIDRRCLIHHLPNNYANGSGPHGQVPLEELLIVRESESDVVAAGYLTCARLTVSHDKRVRDEARKNFTHYAKSARELFSANVRPIDWRSGDGYAPTNPSVCVGPDGRRLALVRTINYTMTNDGQYPTIDGSNTYRTVNHVVEFDHAWNPVKSTRIEDVPGISHDRGFHARGFEDCRLWCDGSTFRASATVRALCSELDQQDPYYGSCEMATLRFDDAWRVTGVDVIRDYEHDKMQKNWMPVTGKPGTFVYLCDPTITIECAPDGTVERSRNVPPVCLVDLRGGSQLIEHGDGWLAITHEVAWRPERVYLHRFVKFDERFRVVGVSDPFYFVKVGLEFCAGLARDGEKLVASFAVDESSVHLAVFDPSDVDHGITGVDQPIAPPAGGLARVCLNMIVKNESAIIERCLESALPFIDSWAITDTGSTDDTIERIEKFFADRSIPGKLTRGTFKNFAQARNDALAAAKTSADWEYVLLIDADMTLGGSIDKSALRAPAYQILQHEGRLEYWNTRLLRRNALAGTYVGVTHEYLSVEGLERLPSLVVDDRADGGSKGDKGDRDIRLLNGELTEKPNDERSMFYLAQTYRGMGRHHEAIQWYRRRIERGGWDEEVWCAHYGIAHSRRELNDEPNFVKACLDAYNYRPSRGEPLKLLARYYRERGKNEVAALVAESLSTVPLSGDSMFVERDVYDYGSDQELAIAGFYSKVPRLREAGYQACARLTVHPDHTVREEARKNFTFYAKSAREAFGAEVRPIDWKPGDGYAPMNPSVCVDSAGRRLVLVRTVNYTVTQSGQYPTVDGSDIIRTRNHVVEFDADWKPVRSTAIEDASGLQRSAFPVEGFEDCRLWQQDGQFFASTTVRDLADNPDGRCEMAVARLDEEWHVTSLDVIRDYEHDRTQKNWMPIARAPRMNRRARRAAATREEEHGATFLYLCDPTIVLERSPLGTTKEIARHQPSACLVDLRGGSQLVEHGDGWLAVTHEVAWRPERVYLHRFVKFDREFRAVAVSDPWYFLQVGIEFCAGLARDGERLVASFGVNDASAHLVFFDPARVNRSLREVR